MYLFLYLHFFIDDDLFHKVKASICESNSTIDLQYMMPESPVQVGGLELPILNGTASYHSLYINEAGDNYLISFTLSESTSLEGPVEVLSNSFSVIIGQPSKLKILNDPSFAEEHVSGGKVFTNQPRIAIIDAGNNLIERHISSLQIRANLFDHMPINAKLNKLGSGSEDIIETINKGIAQFNGLSIDKIGNGFQIMYSLVGEDLDENLIEVGPSFNVVIGDIFDMNILQSPTHALSNNQPFLQQPMLSLVDRGHNVVSEYEELVIKASLVESLSLTSTIVINTESSPIVSIVSVYFDPVLAIIPSPKLAPGDVIAFFVNFTDEVVVTLADDGVLPKIEMNIPGEETAFGHAVLSEESVNNSNKALKFMYNVSMGNNIEAFEYVSTMSFNTEGAIISDALQRNVNLTLPQPYSECSLIGSNTVKISDSAPFITDINVPLLSGEYGAGQAVDFSVVFSRPVRISIHSG